MRIGSGRTVVLATKQKFTSSVVNPERSYPFGVKAVRPIGGPLVVHAV